MTGEKGQTFEIRQCSVDMVRPYLKHLERHFSEILQEENLYHPFHKLPDFKSASNREKLKKSWELDVGQIGWERVWVVLDCDGVMRGHLELRHSKIPFVKHRCGLGMGLEKEMRGQGYGEKLLLTAINWAKALPKFHGLDWIELNAFSKNLPAIKLYEKVGFKKNGEVLDCFRVRGQKVDDISMAYSLR